MRRAKGTRSRTFLVRAQDKKASKSVCSRGWHTEWAEIVDDMGSSAFLLFARPQPVSLSRCMAVLKSHNLRLFHFVRISWGAANCRRKQVVACVVIVDALNFLDADDARVKCVCRCASPCPVCFVVPVSCPCRVAV